MPLESELEAVSREYRALERQKYFARPYERDLHDMIERDPGMKNGLNVAWKAIGKALRERAMAVRGYDFQAHMLHAKQCFQMSVIEQNDPERAKNFTMQRLGLVGDQVSFLRRLIDTTKVAQV